MFPFRDKENSSFFNEEQNGRIKLQIENQEQKIENQLQQSTFNIDFFSKLGFFHDNIVAIGANGSGKTTLSNHLKQYLPNNGAIISAQRILIIPTFGGISNITKTSEKLTKSQTADKSYKTTFSTENSGGAYSILSSLGNEFQILLDNLLAERSAIRNKFCDSLQNGSENRDVPITKLDIAIKIWNSLMEHKIMECSDGINIMLKGNGEKPYPAYQMSDGEKVMLFLISQVLQAPNSSFIIIDEPEMYLHKTILTKLWDTLEKERQDCIFIYLTHDLDFATSRTTAKKVWIKSFKYPDNWEIEKIPNNELPEPLLLELLGSRKNILFCEGKKGKLDEKIYNLLFPEYTVTPVGNCFAVINYTKAFNKIPQITTKAFGIIDSDHHNPERLKSLKQENIFSFEVTEPENLLLDEFFLKEIASHLCFNGEVDYLVNKIIDKVIDKLKDDIEIQTANYVTAKINYYFKDSHVSKGNSLNSVISNFTQFTNEIKIQEWYEKRKKYLLQIIHQRDYKKVLSIYNNKGLKTFANQCLKISNYQERAIDFLQYNPQTISLLRKYFPEEL